MWEIYHQDLVDWRRTQPDTQISEAGTFVDAFTQLERKLSKRKEGGGGARSAGAVSMDAFAELERRIQQQKDEEQTTKQK